MFRSLLALICTMLYIQTACVCCEYSVRQRGPSSVIIVKAGGNGYDKNHLFSPVRGTMYSQYEEVSTHGFKHTIPVAG